MTDLASRYGASGRPRWLWPLVAVVGIAIGVAWAAWIAWQPRPVTAELYGYDVVGEHRVDITLNVHRSEPAAVVCTVYARAADHAIVGEKTVEVPASAKETVRVPVELETERRAVTGVLRTCESLD